MGSISEEAKNYTSSTTANISELDKVSTAINVEDDEFETTDEEGHPKIVKQKIINVDGNKYRVPASVLKSLKVILEDSPDLKFFKVKKSGQGMNTEYTVIPLSA